MRKIFTFIFCFLPALAFANIEIENDEMDCLEGWLSMDVTIIVDGEKFDFRPSCDFSFDTKFKTSKGEECSVEAGMCSGFSPEKRLEVRCEQSGSEGIDIYCPRKK